MKTATAVLGLTLIALGTAYAQTPPAADERLNLEVTFIAGYGHDGAQATLGFEKQGRVGEATLTLSRQVERSSFATGCRSIPSTRSRPSRRAANRTSSFPNDPRLYSAGPVVPCDPENGHKRVDTYNTFALDYIVQQGPLREGFVDWLATDAVTARFGRFILPVGFAPEDVGSWTAKDMTRIQRLNAEANFGLMLEYARPLVRGGRDRACSARAIARKTTTGSTSPIRRSTPTAR